MYEYVNSLFKITLYMFVIFSSIKILYNQEEVLENRVIDTKAIFLSNIRIELNIEKNIS